MTLDFYDQLAPYYHLLYPDWEASMARQARGLAKVLGEFGVESGSSILDAACGIGTQTLGLSQLGYRLTASDLSSRAIERARVEAERRHLSIEFVVADLRELSQAFDRTFDAVIACDNAIPHLLSDAEILVAFDACRRVVAPGGVFIISVRDYTTLERRSPDVHSYGARDGGDRQFAAEQVWQWDGDQYDVTLRLTETTKGGPAVVREFKSRYYAVTIATLEKLLIEAGFSSVERRDTPFFQPLLIASTASVG